MAILRLKNADGSWVDVPEIHGENAYEGAVRNGFTGTEAEFYDQLSHFTAYANQAKDAADRAEEVMDSIPQDYQTLDQHVVDLTEHIVEVSETQPTNEQNKLWIQPTSEEVRVPTYEEFEELRDSVAPIEENSTFSKGYSKGENFIHDGGLCKTTEDVAQGDTITLGTNCRTVPGGVTGEVTDLKSILPEWIRLSDVVVRDGTNILPTAKDRGVGAYLYLSNRLQYRTDSFYANYSYAIFETSGNTKYTFSTTEGARWWVCTDEFNTVTSYSSNTVNKTITTDANAKYLYVSYLTAVNTAIAIGDSVVSGTIYDLPKDVVPFSSLFIEGDKKIKFDKVSGNIANNAFKILQNSKCELRKGQKVVFTADLSGTCSVEIGRTSTLDSITKSNYLMLTSESAIFKNLSTGGDFTFNHELTLENNVQIIFELTDECTLTVTIISNGNSAKYTFTSYGTQGSGAYYIKNNGDALNNAELMWMSSDINKKVWIFGDSYVQYSNSRWTYYLHECGFDGNTLINGFGGESSAVAIASLKNLLKYGTPLYIVWFMGMNDRSDDGSAATNWLNAVTEFIEICNKNGILPILSTIPTVSSKNNEYKNAWVKASGYRYVDMAKAVGAKSDGTWYNGMLSSDNVHPSATGAKALFAQVLEDFPEVMITD